MSADPFDTPQHNPWKAPEGPVHYAYTNEDICLMLQRIKQDLQAVVGSHLYKATKGHRGMFSVEDLLPAIEHTWAHCVVQAMREGSLEWAPPND